MAVCWQIKIFWQKYLFTEWHWKPGIPVMITWSVKSDVFLQEVKQINAQTRKLNTDVKCEDGILRRALSSLPLVSRCLQPPSSGLRLWGYNVQYCSQVPSSFSPPWDPKSHTYIEWRSCCFTFYTIDINKNYIFVDDLLKYKVWGLCIELLLPLLSQKFNSRQVCKGIDNFPDSIRINCFWLNLSHLWSTSFNDNLLISHAISSELILQLSPVHWSIWSITSTC